MLLNYTDSCVLLFSNLVFYSFFVFSGNSQHQYQLLQCPFPNFHTSSLKNDFYWLLDFTNICAQLFPDHQFSLYFLMNIETTSLQQSIIFNL